MRRTVAVTLVSVAMASALVVTQSGVPAAPINLAVNVAASSVTLTWQPGSGATPTGYQVEAALVSSGPVIASVPVATTTLTVNQVPDGTYFVRVRALNASGASAPSQEVVVTVGTPRCGVPNAPGPLSHTVNGDRVALSWPAAAGGCPVAQYVVRAGSSPGLSNLANLNVGLQTSLQATAPTGTYYVRVNAVNASGESAPSNEQTVIVAPTCAAPGAPQGFTAAASGTTVSVSWQPPVSGGPPAAYILEAGSTPTTSNLGQITVSGLTFTASAPPATYYLRVRATNACGLGPASPTQQLTVGCAPPGTPGSPSTSVSGTTVTLTWAPLAGISQYVVEVGTAAGMSNTTVRTVTGTSTQITGLPAATYFTRIRALNACGTGGPSGEATFTIPFIRRLS